MNVRKFLLHFAAENTSFLHQDWIAQGMNQPFLKSTLAFAVLSAMASATLAHGSTTTAQPEAVKLQTIVVTAAGYEQDLTQAPASMTVITREELEKRNYNDINDALRNTPGVVVTGSGSAQSISIRGMGSNYTLFLVDGKRQYSKDVNPNGDDSGFEKNILPPMAAVERIEIIRGPASTLYGTDAMGGVINIITKKVTDEWTGSLELGTVLQDSSQSGDITEGSAYLAGPLIANTLGLQIGVNKQEREEDNYVGGFRNTERESVNSRLTYVVNDNHDFKLDANFIKQTSETTIGKTIAVAGPGETQTAGSKGRNYRSVYSLTHDGRYTDTLSSSTYVQLENSKNPDRSNGVTSGIESDTWIANTQWDWDLDKHQFIFGGYFKNEELIDRATNRNSALPITELERWGFALFAEDTWSITDRFNLTTGVRYDHDENYDGNFSPRLYGVYNLNDAWTFKGGVSTGYKQPDLKQSSSDVHSATGGGSAFIMGNENLKPEKSVTYELGAAWQGERSNATLTAYYTQFKDRISEDRTCQSPGGANNKPSTWACVDPFGRLDENGDPLLWNFYGSRFNIDKAMMQGIEATYEIALADHANLAANYTYTDTEIQSGQYKGNPLNQMPEHMFNVTVDYDINDQLNVWNRLHYRSETSQSLGRSSMTVENPGYTFLDVGFNYAFNSNLKGKFGVYNLLDEKAEDADGDQLLDGRRYSVGLVASF